MANDNYLYINAIKKKYVPRTPIWIMRQAGRYLPEYRKIRDKYDFLTVCKTPELATEVTLQPIRRFGFDAAILFSDILVIPEAMGVKLEFMEDHGPKLSPQILTEKDLERLSTESIEKNLDYVEKAVRMLSSELSGKTPLIGFSGSPFTLATYMVEGKPTKNFKFIKSLMFQRPDLLHHLLSKLTNAIILYLKMQIKNGADALQIFDTWGGILAPHIFQEFSANYMAEIITELKEHHIPVTVYTKGSGSIISQLLSCNADMISIDWATDIKKAKEKIISYAAIQGNLDPTVLYGNKQIIKSEIERILSVFGSESGHVFNLGHGILPDIPVANVEYLVEEVKRQSEILHKISN